MPEEETVTVTFEDADAEAEVAAVIDEHAVEEGDSVLDVEAVAVVVIVAESESDPVDDVVTLDETHKVATAVCVDE